MIGRKGKGRSRGKRGWAGATLKQETGFGTKSACKSPSNTGLVMKSRPHLYKVRQHASRCEQAADITHQPHPVLGPGHKPAGIMLS